MAEYEISKLARDAHIIDIYEGVREVQNMILEGSWFGKCSICMAWDIFIPIM